ncbi:phosphotransferase enzyme family protein [Rufibacter latericius]|uniref:Aminoglycoside phosphotransferase family protein n=1 Tax=Rufibacter latericius TaxID=2487040 RepID=A0A3M9MN00_9BACT|nr:aminoglycoside phosphotransferase family protein [Rufibacter latericius]RNI26048.1 aminoglycoside phosphotransferase family protein [Rufibacter latericius]
MRQIGTLDGKVPSILAQFTLKGGVAKVVPYGSGHIHDTFQVVNSQADAPDYLLQRVNHHVFKNVPALMDNIQVVTTHLRQKLEGLPDAKPQKEVLTLIPTVHQKWFYHDEEGNYWRMYLFLDGTFGHDMVTTPAQAYEGGKAFGKFQALLSDLPVELLHDTIPDFHNVVNRLRLFRETVQANPVGRVAEVEAEIAFVEERAQAMSTIYYMGQKGELPLRITHNDTKFNNVLLGKDGKAQCVIDLDTVMPGYVAYDFGDAIRTTVNTAPEDEPQLERIQVDLSLFEAFAKGFLEETSSALTDSEIASLLHGVLLLPFIMGLRFLTDYIDGDHYYKIHFPEHNLQRCRAQFQLVKQLEAQQSALQAILEKVVQETRLAEISTKA